MAAFLKKLWETISFPWNYLKKQSPLASFITGRIATMAALLFILGLAMFALMELAPGDIVDQMMTQQIASSMNSTSVSSSQISKDNSFTTDQGQQLRISLISRTQVSFLILSRLKNSIVLNLISLVFITSFSFLLGVYFSSKAGTRTDVAATFFALFFHAFPGILLLILLQLFASITGLFPVTGYPNFPFSENPMKFSFSYVHHIFLPLLASFLGGVGGTMRMIRSTMLDQMGLPYIMALRSRGICERRIYLNHAFKNTLNPYITGSANLLASLFSGSLILEIIFSYPGIGRLMYEAVTQQDVNLVLANSMFVSALVLAGMIISDITLAIVDPRIRYK